LICGIPCLNQNLNIMKTHETLSRREVEILQELSTGKLYKEIAYDNHISLNTVKKHLKNVYRKLGANSKTEAINIHKNSQIPNTTSSD
jgi:DNA-binding NarL/FixJ family response regulator